MTEEHEEPSLPASPGRFRYKLGQAEIWANTINNVVRWGALVAMTYYAYRAVGMLAGHTTNTDIGIKILANVRSSVAWIFGTGGTVYGLRQRKLRRDAIEQLSDRREKYERLHDPNRTSSDLNPRGQTQPKDKL